MPAPRPVSISNKPPEYPALDFKFLYEEGLHHIQRLGGSSWTDHNTHDPGITILEQLCYALTDLAYRLTYDIPDLLTHEDGTAGESLYSAAQILTVNPVTLADIRKVVLDVPGVKNAWVEQVAQPSPALFYDDRRHTLELTAANGQAAPLHLAGLYRVLVEPQQDDDPLLEAAVWARLQRCRSLCEDFTEVQLLPPQEIRLSGTIELKPGADIDALAAAVLFQVAELVSPHIRFYTLQERLASGLAPDAIFDGPVLQHGFIDDGELAARGRRTELHFSDVIRVIMDVPGVLGVHDISLDDSSPRDGSKQYQPWLLALDPAKIPRLSGSPLSDKLRFVQKGLVVWPDKGKVTTLLENWREAHHYPPLNPDSQDLGRPAGRYRSPGTYYSIQHHFPLVYGLGEVGLPDSASPQRQAEMKQLKAYLLFFEQLLAGYFAQVGQLKDLLTFKGPPAALSPFQELVGRVPGAAAVVQELGTAQPTEAAPQTDQARLDEQLAQQNRFLTHLLARFGESIIDYAQVVPQQWVQGEHQPEQLLASKRRFLQAYPQLSNDRGKAFDYTAPSWDTSNVAGLEKRVAAKLGIANWQRRSLAHTTEEGFHLLEHILLRPLAADAPLADTATSLLVLNRRPITTFRSSGTRTVCTSPGHQLTEGAQIRIIGTQGYNGTYTTRKVRFSPDTFEIDQPFTKDEAGGSWLDDQLPPDPYSLQLSFIFPDWLPRFSDPELALRAFVEQTIREQTPAHLRVYVKWLSPEDMAAFEGAYQSFLEQLQLTSHGRA